MANKYAHLAKQARRERYKQGIGVNPHKRGTLKGCLLKVGYPTRASAERAVERNLKRGRRLSVYYCTCGRYHLTSHPSDSKAAEHKG